MDALQHNNSSSPEQVDTHKITRTYSFNLKMRPTAHTLIGLRLKQTRQLYNHLLDLCKNAYEEDGQTLRLKELGLELTRLRNDPAVACLNRTLQVSVIKRLLKARDAFFRRVKKNTGEKPGFPRFKGRDHWHTLECDANVSARGMVKIDGQSGHLQVKGLGAMKFRVDRNLPSINQLAGFRIVSQARRTIVQLVYGIEQPVPTPINEPCRPVGIDVGVKSLLSFSDGSSIPGRKDDDRRVHSLQRRLARAKRGHVVETRKRYC